MKTECAECGDEFEVNYLLSGRCGYCVLGKVIKNPFFEFDTVLSEFHANLMGFSRHNCFLVDFKLHQKEVIGTKHNTTHRIVFASRKNGTEMYKLYGLASFGRPFGDQPVRAYLAPIKK